LHRPALTAAEAEAISETNVLEALQWRVAPSV
jgi:hypothetical protein